MIEKPFGRAALMRGGTLVGSGALVSAGAAVVITLVLARQLGSTGLGQYSVVIATSGLLATIGRFGQGPILIRHLAHTPSDECRPPVSASSLIVATAITAIAVAMLTPLGTEALLRSTGIGEAQAPLLIILFASTSAYALVAEAFRGMQRFALASYFGLLMQRILFLLALGFSATMLLPELSPHRAVTFAALAAVGTLLVSGSVLVAILREQGPLLPTLRQITVMSKAGIPLVLAGVVAVVTVRIPIWTLGNGGSYDQAGIFSLAAAMAAALAMIPQVANNTLAPFIASAYASGERSSISRRLGIVAAGLTVVTIAISLVILVIGLLLTKAALGSEFASAIPTFAILAAGVAARTTTGPCGLVLNVTGFQRWNLVASTAGAIAAVFAVVLLAPAYGAVGAAVGVVLASIVQNALLMTFARSHVAIRTHANFATLGGYLLNRDHHT